MKRTKKVIALLLAGVMAFSASTFAFAEEGDSDSYKEITVAVDGDPQTLAPYAATSLDSRVTLNLMYYQTLFYFEEAGGEFMPLIGDSIESDFDNNTTTVTIREGVYDSAGYTIDANDVAFCFNYTKEEANSVMWNMMLSCEAVDDYTVVFTWDDDFLESLGYLAQLLIYGCNIFSEESWNESKDGMVTDPVGSGPYVVSSYSAGTEVVLTKNENYWMADQGLDIPYIYQQNADQINVEIINEQAQFAIALESGAVDFATVSEDDLNVFEDNPDYNIYDIEDFLGWSVRFNFASPYCSDLNLRKAILYAIDAEGLLDAVAGGKGQITHALAGSTTSCADYNAEWDTREYYDFDMDTAQEYLDIYLEETGQSASDITLKILAANIGYASKICEVIQAYILSMGMNCEIEVLDNTTATSALSEEPDRYDIFVTGSGTNGNVAAFGLDEAQNTSFHFDKDSEDYAELLTYAEPCVKTSTATEENIEAIWEYAYEQAFGKGLFKGTSSVVSDTKISNIVTDVKGHYIWGSFELAD